MSSNLIEMMQANKLANSKLKPTVTTGPVQDFLALLVTGQLPVMDFLDGDHWSILKLLHVCKATRKAAVRKLRSMQEDPFTRWKQQALDQWLAHPTFSTDEQNVLDVFPGMQPAEARGKLCGPLRLPAINKSAAFLQERFVILSYKKHGYLKEECVLALVRGDGTLSSIAWVKVRTNMLSGPSVWELIHYAYDPYTYPEATEPSTTNENEFFHAHLALRVVDCCVMLGTELSPAELFCVLLHAMFADMLAVRNIMHGFFDEFDTEFHAWEQELSSESSRENAGLLQLVRAKREQWKHANWE